MEFMVLPVDVDSFDYRFNKTLNEDVRLKSDEYGKWDLDIDNGDYVNCTGLVSLNNACIIAIMTRFNEVKTDTYDGFGCKAHELIKDNKTKLTRFKLETYIEEVLRDMRRVHEVNYVEISEDASEKYNVNFSVTSINDEIVKGSVAL